MAVHAAQDADGEIVLAGGDAHEQIGLDGAGPAARIGVLSSVAPLAFDGGVHLPEVVLHDDGDDRVCPVEHSDRRGEEWESAGVVTRAVHWVDHPAEACFAWRGAGMRFWERLLSQNRVVGIGLW